MELFISGLTLGFLASGHCLGMCGPIAFFLGAHQLPPDSPWTKKVLLFLILGFGKALTYAWFGLAFGFAGHVLTRWSQWFGFSLALPWISGSLFILAGLVMAGWLPRFHSTVRGLEKRLSGLLQTFRKKQDLASLFAMGMLWGLLPCPMVLAPALAASVSGAVGGMEGAMRGFFLMLSFGLGTIPALYFGAAAGNWLSQLRRYSPLVLGITFILLGIASILFPQILMNLPGVNCPMHGK